MGTARLFGLDEVLATRVLFTLFAAACASAIYLLGRDLFRSRYAGFAAAAALICFSGFVEYATNGPREKTPMMLFLILALWMLTRRKWFAAGFFLSMATLTLQIAFFFGAPALAVVWALQSGPGLQARARAGLRIVVGGLVPLVALTAYFWAVDAARAFLDAFVVINARYTVPGPVPRRAGGQLGATRPRPRALALGAGDRAARSARADHPRVGASQGRRRGPPSGPDGSVGVRGHRHRLDPAGLRQLAGRLPPHAPGRGRCGGLVALSSSRLHARQTRRR